MSFDAARLQPDLSPSPDALPFWEGLSRRELLLPHCLACDAPFFYPRVLCPRCGSRDLEWRRASGRGNLHSFCVQYHSSVPGLGAAVPFVTALVDLDEGPRIMAFLVDVPADPELLRCDIRVVARYLDLGSGHTVLAFAPDEAGAP